MEPTASVLLDALRTYVDRFHAGTLDAGVKSTVVNALKTEERTRIYQEVADNIWDLYLILDVDLAVLILRKWMHLDPDSREAKRALGSYLLAHGPDWDEEGKSLLSDTSDGEQ
ncbi:hypothetical protein [Tuwongella immobilis]|uniref:Uncharacterized protein n=1 Tax=Tuwongella immobilis TaxID=692036 RepID=A0A6C2YHQ0_9BACT|nr:hypothetical protein [Tuwongella immobilis]VIP00781.1 unnamed protein product [Tuwongella immobilis]VTR96980.1 unnamed protein product [Tuwongella immobilis]